MENRKQPGKIKQKTSLVRRLLLPSVIVVQIAIAYFLVTLYLLPKYGQLTGKDASVDIHDDGDIAAIGEVFIISGLTINPIDSKGRRFAVFEIALECHDKKIVNLLKRYEPRIKDEFIALLRSKTVAELSLSSAMESTKKQLHKIVNEILGEWKIDNIYFTEFVLQ